MKKYLCLLLTMLLLSGCATTDWNNFLYGNPSGPNPDYVICPFCYTISDVQTISSQYQTLQCYYCKNNFSRAEGKKLYNIALAEYNKTTAPAKIIAQEQAKQATLNRLHDSYQRSAERQQQNIQAFQQYLSTWGQNRNTQRQNIQNMYKPGSSPYNPLHIKIED